MEIDVRVKRRVSSALRRSPLSACKRMRSVHTELGLGEKNAKFVRCLPLDERGSAHWELKCNGSNSNNRHPTHTEFISGRNDVNSSRHICDALHITIAFAESGPIRACLFLVVNFFVADFPFVLPFCVLLPSPPHRERAALVAARRRTIDAARAQRLG